MLAIYTNDGVANIIEETVNNLMFGVSHMSVFGNIKDSDNMGLRLPLKQNSVDFRAQYFLVLKNNFVFNAGLCAGRNNIVLGISDGDSPASIQKDDLGVPYFHFGANAGVGYAFVNNEKFLVYKNAILGFDLSTQKIKTLVSTTTTSLVTFNVGADMAFVYKFSFRAGVAVDIQCVGKFGSYKMKSVFTGYDDDYYRASNENEMKYNYIGFGVAPTLSLNLML